MVYAQILFVVETNDLIKSDDFYYSWIIRQFYGAYVSNQGFENIRISYGFIHMDGKTNYKKKRVVDDIKTKTKMFSDGKTFIVYCIDHDNSSTLNKAFVSEVQAYCKDNGYYFVVCYREIEDVLHVPNAPSKTMRVRLFAKKPPKRDVINKTSLSVGLTSITNKIGLTNIMLVLDEILLIIKKPKQRQ